MVVSDAGMTTRALTHDTVAWLLALSVPVRCTGAVAPPATTPGDGSALLEALSRHGTGAIALRRLGEFPVCRSIEPALRAAQAQNAHAALSSLALIGAIGCALAATGVAWCVLKGVPLALQHYGDLAARRVGDIDILVPPHQVQSADAALQGCGWQRVGLSVDEPLPPLRYWHEQRYVEPGGTTLELHHRLHPNPYLLALSTGQVLADVTYLDVGDLRVPVLDPVTELLYLSTHGSRHAWYRLLWVCDIAAITANAAPDLLDRTYRAALRLRLQQPLAQALLLAERLLAASAPPWAHALHQRSRRQRRLLGFAQESLWGARDGAGNPVNRTRSSLLSSLCQRAGMRFWAWELVLRARHEWRGRLAPA